MDKFDKARHYVSKIPGAISGSGGHNQTYWVAAACLHGFQLSPAQTMEILQEFNARCSPPWTEKELQHKIDSFDASKCQKPSGWLLSSSSGDPEQDRQAYRSSVKSSGPDKKFTIRYQAREEKLATRIPSPIPNGMIRLLLAAFEQGEVVRLAGTTLNKDGREIPNEPDDYYDGFFTREYWLKKLEEHRLWEDANGLYMCINPLDGKGRADKHVTAHRHLLVESDTLPKDEQYRILKSSGLPITAIVDSGGKSLHAWVRVDAKTPDDYRSRQAIIYDWLAKHGMPVDEANKNPSRLTRGPNMHRVLPDGTRTRQELLELNVGAQSYTEWAAKIKAEELGDALTIESLDNFDYHNDPNTLLGQRWLCRGGSCLWVGQSGVGKSSLTTQAALTWAIGKPFFGIEPVEPLRSLIIQAENDIGDLAEMVAGIKQGRGGFDWEELELVERNVLWHRDTTHTGQEFCSVLLSLINRYQPHLVWLDPMLSFIGGDISKQEVCSQFLRNWLNPIAESTGACFHLVHHTGKPPKDKSTTKDWNTNDFAYLGIGSSELVNWARAVNIITEVTDGTFKFMLAKRGKRAHARTPDGQHTTHIYLKHSDRGIYWEQISESEVSKQMVTESALRHNEEQAEKESIYEYLSERFDWSLLRTRMHTTGHNKTELRAMLAEVLAKRQNFTAETAPPPFPRARFLGTPLENHGIHLHEHGIEWSDLAAVYYNPDHGEPLPRTWRNEVLHRPDCHPSKVIPVWPDEGLTTKQIAEAYHVFITGQLGINVTFRTIYERDSVARYMEREGMLEHIATGEKLCKFYRPLPPPPPTTTTTTIHSP